MKTILLFADFRKYGGAHDHFFNTLLFLNDCGFKVHVVLPSKESIQPGMLPVLRQQAETVRYWPKLLNNALLKPGHFINKSKLIYFFRFIYLLRLRLERKYDKVILSIISPGSYLSAAVLWRHSFYILHTYPHGGLRGQITKLIFSLRQILITSLLDRGFKIVSVSQYAVKRIYEGWLGGQPHVNLTYIYNFNPIARQPKRIAGGAMHVVGTLGHVEWYKNPELWLEVAVKVVSSIPSAVFIWGGDGALLEDMRAKVPEKLKDHIKFPGRVDDKKSFFESICVYFQPSILESHGISVVEAMGFSLPCIVSSEGGLQETVVDGVTGFTVSLDDVSGYVEHIKMLLNDSAAAEVLGKAGNVRANEVFSEGKWRSRMTDIFEIRRK